MFQKSLVYGLIPARGGSQGLRGKNLRTLCGKPLITYVIRSALGAKTLNSVFVSTDSNKIAAVAKQLGVDVILHSNRLSRPVTPTFAVIRNAVRFFIERGKSPDVVVTMRATSPLCLARDIDKAVKLLLRTPKADSVISVTKSDVHPYKTLKINERGELNFFDRRSPEVRFPYPRQSFGAVYIRNGAVYATRTHVIKSGSLWGKHSLPLLMPKERSVNINDKIDFLLAEALMQGE